MAGRRSDSPDLTGLVRSLARGGDAVVETPRGLVFASGALPGERVRLVGVKRAGKILRGRVAEVIEPSPERVEPPCPLVERCGGCPWMAVSLEAQREIKRRFVSEAAGVEAVLEPGGVPLGYRRRARLAFARSARAPRARIGYRGRRSHDIVDVDACAVLEPVLATALAAVRDAWAAELVGEGEIALAVGAGGAAVIALRTAESQPAGVYEAARGLAAADGVAGVALRAGGATADAIFGDPRERSVSIDGEAVWGAVAGFSQAQDEVNRRLVERVLELAAPEGASVLELYAGHGNLTVPLAATAASVVAVEQDAAAADACRANLAARGLRARVITGDAASHAAGERVDAVVLDPPRTGARDALEGIVRRRPDRIVYVSCDTATLSRDLEALRQARYTPTRASAFDMFPQTAHVEAVVLCERAAR